MCLCTQYDSPTCGHSWISMSQPCGLCQDLVNCPRRDVYQSLVAPPMACPQCNGGFGDCETLQMIQGPWGCDQMVRCQMMSPGRFSGLGGGASMLALGGLGGWHADTRLTGPYGGLGGYGMGMEMGMGGPMSISRVICGREPFMGDLMGEGCGDYGYGRRRGTSRHYREYRRSTRYSNTKCAVM